jgi:hypothetical protein
MILGKLKWERQEKGGMGHREGEKEVTEMFEKIEAMFFEV